MIGESLNYSTSLYLFLETILIILSLDIPDSSKHSIK